MRTAIVLLFLVAACLEAPPELDETTGEIIGNLCSEICTPSSSCSTVCSGAMVSDSTCGSYGECNRPATPYCGDGICGAGENRCSCPGDCKTGTCLQGWATTAWGDANTNRCVPNVLTALAATPQHGSKLAFYRNSHPDVSYISPMENHWQSVQRLAGTSSQYLFLTRSYNYSSGTPPLAAIARMTTRTSSGLKMGSNLPASGSDGIVATIWQETMPVGGYFRHAGGSQVVGKYAGIPLESSDDGYSRMVVYDLGAPTSPFRTSSLELTPWFRGRAGVVGMVKLKDGRYLALVSDDSKLVFFVTAGTTLAGATWTYFDTWLPSETSADWQPYQNLQFITQCDGTLFVGGSWKTGGSLGSAIVGGDDLIDFYKVSNASFTSNSVRLDHVKQKHMYCDDWCNFDAASGPYVDPAGNVIWYGTEHQDSALTSVLPPAVKLREYAP